MSFSPCIVIITQYITVAQKPVYSKCNFSLTNEPVLIKLHTRSLFLEQETLPLLLSTGWFQEGIRA